MGRIPRTLAPALAATLALALAGIAAAAMQSTKLGPSLCETNGGGRFVEVPGFPGERIDRRLLRDVRLLERRYSIFVTDGYSTDPVHAANGEHPIGLALDIVPNKAAGGRWADIDRLAAWAEPRQDRPREPFRWVGYDGDRGHGRGNHLHLSWSHSEVRPRHPARTVYTVRCPRPGGAPAPEQPGTEETEQPLGSGGSGGGTHAGAGGSGGSGSGGVGARPRLARPVIELGGVGG
jgi:hypothetical protein